MGTILKFNRAMKLENFINSITGAKWLQDIMTPLCLAKKEKKRLDRIREVNVTDFC